MNYRKHTALILAAVAFAACSEPDTVQTVPAPKATRVRLLSEGAAGVSVYAFRRQGEAFLFDTLFRDGLTAGGTLSVRMRNGQYKFLFASGADRGLVLQPEPLTRQTTWEETVFALRENDALPGTRLPADELYLQETAAAANTVYKLDGTDLSVKAKLRRAVSRIAVNVKRGYREGANYVEVPYTKPQSALDEIDRIELSIENTGLHVRPDGSGGTATVTATLAAADYRELTDEGYILLDGPFVIPPADGGDVALDISVVPAAGSALKPEPLHLTGKAQRNERLEVTLWITSGYPGIGVEIRTAPIEREQEGDTGIWE